MARGTKATAPEAKAESETSAHPRDPDEPTMEERARALVASYEHGMEHSSPRTMNELNELRAVLLGKG